MTTARVSTSDSPIRVRLDEIPSRNNPISHRYDAWAVKTTDALNAKSPAAEAGLGTIRRRRAIGSFEHRSIVPVVWRFQPWVQIVCGPSSCGLAYRPARTVVPALSGTALTGPVESCVPPLPTGSAARLSMRLQNSRGAARGHRQGPTGKRKLRRESCPSVGS